MIILVTGLVCTDQKAFQNAVAMTIYYVRKTLTIKPLLGVRNEKVCHWRYHMYSALGNTIQLEALVGRRMLSCVCCYCKYTRKSDYVSVVLNSLFHVLCPSLSISLTEILLSSTIVPLWRSMNSKANKTRIFRSYLELRNDGKSTEGIPDNFGQSKIEVKRDNCLSGIIRRPVSGQCLFFSR